MTIKHLSIMKEISLTLCDFSPAESVTGVFGFIVFEIIRNGESYGYFATEKVARKRIKSLRKQFNFSFSIVSHIVSV